MLRRPAALLIAVAIPASASAQTLDIGDKAPAIHADVWLKGKAVDATAPDSLVLIEFWATWCGPCIDSIPHLSELQHTYGPKGLSVVGFTNQDDDNRLDKVKAFVKERDKSMAYAIAFEEKDKTTNAYLKASNSMGIPTAFLVSKGKVAWIGHPLELTHETLDAVIGGSYDLTVARKRRALDTELMEAYWEGDWNTARDVALEMSRLEPESGAPYLLLFDIYAERLGDAKAAQTAGSTALKLYADHPVKLAEAANAIAREDDPHGFNTMALAAVNKAVAAAPNDADVLIAHFRVLMATGDFDKATASANKAIDTLDGKGGELGMFASSLATPDSPGRCHDLALKAVERAIAAEPEVLNHLQTKFRILWYCRKDQSAAETVGLYMVNLATKQDAGMLNNLAWSLLTEDPTIGKFNRLALAAARKCNELTNNENWMFVDTLALAQFENDLVKEAVATELAAIKLCPADHPAQASLKEALQMFEKGNK